LSHLRLKLAIAIGGGKFSIKSTHLLKNSIKNHYQNCISFGKHPIKVVSLKENVMKTIFFILFSLFFYSGAISQETIKSDSLVQITMKTGDIYIGQILSDDGREVLLLTAEIGKIYLQKENIQSINPYIPGNNNAQGGGFQSSGPFTTRYYFTTNALPIKKSENYAMINLFGPEAHFAITDKFSAGIMTTWIASPMVLALKYTLPTKNPKVNFGLGTLMGTSGYLLQGRGYGGLHWGMVTFGGRLTNVTLSGGFAYADFGFDRRITTPGIYPAVDDGFGTKFFPNSYDLPTQKKSLETAPIFGLGAITKIGKKTSFIFDSMFLFNSNNLTTLNYVYVQPGNIEPDYIEVIQDGKRNLTAFFMPAVRYSFSQNKAFQFAAAGVVARINGDYISFPVPMCSWFFKF
jgi:hypothetical protein